MKLDKEIIEEVTEEARWMKGPFGDVLDYPMLTQNAMELWQLHNKRYSWKRVEKLRACIHTSIGMMEDI